MGRIPTGPNSLPMMERTLALLASAALPPRVISYAADMFALYVGAFAYEESMPPPDVEQMGDLPQDRCRPSSTRCMTGLADDLMAGDPDERFEWALELLIAGLEAMALRERRGQQDGSEVGVVEPPSGSVLTSTASTPSMSPVTDAVAEPSRRGVNSADVGSGDLPGRLSQTM